MSMLSGLVSQTSMTILAIVCWLGGVAWLLKSMRRQDLFAIAQMDAISSLCTHVGECVKTQNEMQQELEVLRQQLGLLQSHQQRAETRVPEKSRINTALKLLKCGTKDAETLREIGLSSTEAELLVRLHGEPAVQDENQAQDKMPAVSKAAKRESDSSASTQAQELASSLSALG